MLRLFTYLTLNAAGEPTVAGTYFDPMLLDLGVQPSNNFIISPVRDGTRRLLKDPQTQFEITGVVHLRTPHVDLASATIYLGATRYLGPVLHYHHRTGLPICLFLESITGTHKKSYVCYITRADAVLTAQCNTNTDEPVLLRRDAMPKILQFQVEIVLDGIYTDIDDITTAAWNARTSI